MFLNPGTDFHKLLKILSQTATIFMTNIACKKEIGVDINNARN